ncbi:MAG: VOC family protein [Thermoleophilia bacterium]|jgi:lactoylglutathione lyase|nr:VOC family protein [Thermoleophilia bacterium]
MPAQLIHTMIRVLDEDRSLAFYGALGFAEHRRRRVGGDTATIIFLGLPDDGARLELTLNDGRTEPYAQGEGYGHIALLTHDLDADLERLAGVGVRPETEIYAPYPGGPRICFVRDPDGYRIELLERDPALPG